MSEKVITKIPITSDNVFIGEDPIGFLQLEYCNLPHGNDTSTYRLSVVQVNTNSSVIKGNTEDGHSYDNVFLTDEEGKIITKLILHYVF